tara:strand:+ start:70 stop:456 length:387 start_codon:yes stop_codon:yes gene_type:complete
MLMPRCDTPGGPPCNPIVLGGPKRGPYDYPILKDEIPRSYPDFRTLPHHPEGMPRRGIPGILDDFPGVHDFDPEFERYPRIPRKLPKIDPDFERYGPGAIMGNQPSVGQEIGKLAGMFLGQFIKDRFG